MKHKWMILIIFVLMVSVSFGQKNIKNMQGNAGKRWAICIGINDYKDKRIVDLKNARSDAKTLAGVLKKDGQFDEVVVFSDDIDPGSENYPKKANVLNKLNGLKASVKPDDLVLFFFSGHGISTGAGEGFLVLANSYRENLNGTSLKVKDVVKWLNEIGVKKSLLLLDANREKFLQTGASLKGLTMESFGQGQVGAAFYGAKPGGFSYDDTGANLGAFAGYVIDGLKGHADSKNNGGNGDGIVSFSELASYIKKGVSQWAASSGKKQVPQTQIFADAFGSLAFSTYGSLPARVFQPAAAPSAASVVQLRKDYSTLKEADVAALIKKQGFFDKKRNASKSFKNGFEAKTISGEKVVIDHAAKLMWHAGGSVKGMEFAQAKAWVNALNQNGYAGYKDWRLPTLEEAASLLESSQKNGNLYIDPAFMNVQKDMWSGDNATSELGWSISFERGQAVRDYFFNYFYVRPVRSET